MKAGIRKALPWARRCGIYGRTLWRGIIAIHTVRPRQGFAYTGFYLVEDFF